MDRDLSPGMLIQNLFGIGLVQAVDPDDMWAEIKILTRGGAKPFEQKAKPGTYLIGLPAKHNQILLEHATEGSDEVREFIVRALVKGATNG